MECFDHQAINYSGSGLPLNIGRQNKLNKLCESFFVVLEGQRRGEMKRAGQEDIALSVAWSVDT